MGSLLHRAWADYLQPLLKRPNRLQVAALCHRDDGAGGIEVLLVTSRRRGRWIVPKGWPIDGFEFAEVAMREAWEEAGAVPGANDVVAVGDYTYGKRLLGGAEVTCEVRVFAVAVERIEGDFPEAGERRREWFPASEAAALVDDPGLGDVIVRFAGNRFVDA